MTVELAPPGFAGSNVTSRPPFPTATQRFAPGHVTEASTNPVVSICTGVVTEGVVGSNVTSDAELSTATHSVVVGHATLLVPPLLSIRNGVRGRQRSRVERQLVPRAGHRGALGCRRTVH